MHPRLVRPGILTVVALAACHFGSPARADWDLQKTFTWRPDFKNIHYMAFPGSVGLQDVAGTQGGADRCANVPDGVIDTSDALCTLYSNRLVNTAMYLSYLDTQACQFRTVSVTNTPMLGIHFQGLADPIDPSRGYIVNLMGKRGMGPYEQGGTLSGPCQPRMAPRTIEASTCTRDLIPNPPDSRLRSADEILCGERNVDWRDDNADGKPDTCPNGLFDGRNRIQVAAFDNDPDSRPESDNMFVVRQVERHPVLGLLFLGTDFPVPPGEAAMLTMRPQQAPRIWDPPLDPLACP